MQKGSTSIGLFLVNFMWVLLIFEVEQFLSSLTHLPFNRIPTLVAPLLAIATVMAGRRKTLYWPLIAFVAMHLVASLFAENAGLSRVPFKFLLYIVLVMASTAAFADTPARLDKVLKLFVLGFAWYGVQGLPTGGKVSWHWLLGNEDSFGPLMCVAIPAAYFYSVATSSARWRWIGRVVFGIGLLGLVVSFARGAALGGAAVLLYIMVLSPNKTRTFMFLMGATIIMVPLIAYFVPLDAYFKEVSSSAGGDPVRAHLWGLAYRVFQTSPFFGVGAGNFGVIADQIATPYDRAVVWGAIYYRAVHSTAMQILAEEGLVGIGLWFTMIYNFFRWNIRLRTKAAIASWRSMGGTDLDLRSITRGLDGAMLGFLITSIFYNQLYIHWFWSLLIFSFVLHRMVVVMPSIRARQVPQGTGPLAPVPHRTG
jgi:O-antigen ligase